MTYLLILFTQFFVLISLLSASETLQKPPLPLSSENKKLDASLLPKTCFTPGQNCIDFILEIIGQAQTSVFVQAYEFTSWPLAQRLCQAKQRGVQVTILMDRSQLTQKTSQLALFQNIGIPIYIDRVPGIAHNKIMIIDQKTVLTGSFNWTEAAQTRNAENLIWIQDPISVQSYLKNWNFRRQKSISVDLFKSGHVSLFGP